MLKKLITLCLLLVLASGPFGCKKSEPTEPVKTEQEMKEEADQEITDENMDQELDKLQKEIDSDTESQ